MGWKQRKAEASGFGDYQPRYVFQIDLANKTEEQIFEGFNQQWRRNIRKAEKEGVTVRQGTISDLEIFHTCYVETAKRDHFTPRSLSYFQTMWTAMREEAIERISLLIATHPDHEGAIAATTMTRVGNHSWYSYGASTTAARDLRPSNAVQWEMIKISLNEDADVYDMRGISDTLDSNNHLFGLIQFKLGTGGYAQEYVGEWDYVLSPIWAKAFDAYMSRRR
jgi:lipid II:glycine glycyltransferase (peptidoglycan interpeptide bridge formation enzyme)